MSFPRYPSYTDSGVEWLGHVPVHWSIMSLKRDLDFLTSGSRGWADSYSDEGELFIRIANLTRNSISLDLSDIQRVTVPDGTEGSRTKVRPGDVLFSITAYLGSVAVVPHDLETAYVSQHVALARLRRSRLESKWVGYVALSFVGKTWFETQSYGGTKIQLSLDDVRDLPIPVPPLAEQTQIAAFLDRETEKIDELVAEQRRLMELLKEKRQAVISHAVTRGLSPVARLKPSGIEWLGDVPAHWEVSKMKWIARMESGHTPDKKIPAYWENGAIPWVSLNDTGYLKDNDYISETAYSISELGIANSSARLLPPRVVVFSRDATIGRCAITTRPMAVSQHFIAWVCGESMIPEFLLLRLRSMTGELDRLTTGATLKTIGMPDVRTLVTPVPPLKEQQAILEWVADQTGKLDTLTAEAQRAIDLLQERRTALISAAVTGQIDVRLLNVR